MQKIEKALVALFVKAQLELMKLEREEDGLETVETVILVAVAVIVAGLLINILTKNFGGNNQGVIGYFFDKIKTKFDSFFT